MLSLLEGYKVFNKACKFLAERSDARDSHGNISVLVRPENASSKTMLIKPSGAEYSDDPDPVIVYFDEGGFTVSPSDNRNPSVDTAHHWYMYRNNKHLAAICHTHSTYATAFAMARRPIEVLCTEHADYFGKWIPCLAYADFSTWGGEVPVNSESVILLESHGLLSFGYLDSNDALYDAVKHAIVAEEIAKKTHLTLQIAGYHDSLDSEEVEKWHKRFKTVYGQK